MQAEVSKTYTPSLALIDQLQNLPTFVAVVEAKSVTGAAKHLLKAPSATTRTISELERAIGFTLFERRPRGMLLNATGNLVLQRSLRIIDEINEGAERCLAGTFANRHTLPSAIRSLLFNGRKLQLLVFLTELRSISLAAAHLGLTQAGASMALSRMEDVIGQPLFYRRVEGMVATEGTEQLVVHAKRVFAELRHLISDIAAQSGSISGAVVIGTTPLGRTPPFITALNEVTAAHPDITILTIENSYDQLVRDLRSAEIDFVLGVLKQQTSQGFETEVLFDDRLAVVVRAGHRLASVPDVAITNLLGERLILPRLNSLARPALEDVFRRAGVSIPKPAVETSDLAIIRQLLATGDMVAITSPFQLMFEIDNGFVTELPIRIDGPARPVGLIQRNGAMLSPAALTVIEVIRRTMRRRRATHDAATTPRAMATATSACTP